MAGLLNAGRVGRPHGLDGSFHVTRPRPRLLELGGSVNVAGTQTEIVRRAGTESRPIVRLDAFSRREEIVGLRGEELLVSRDEAPPLSEDEWLAEDLEGLRVVDSGSDAGPPSSSPQIGVVRRLLAYPSCDLLEVVRPDRADLLVPLVADCVREIDLEAGTVDVDLAFLGEDDPSEARR